MKQIQSESYNFKEISFRDLESTSPGETKQLHREYEIKLHKFSISNWLWTRFVIVSAVFLLVSTINVTCLLMT
jgi:hypothetical protein